jgi:hypothetical protein
VTGTGPREVHVLGGNLAWKRGAHGSGCATACGAVARQLAHACRETFGDAFVVRVHLTPTAAGDEADALQTTELDRLADDLLLDATTAVVILATAICGGGEAPPARPGSLRCVQTAPVSEVQLDRRRRRRAGVVFAVVTTAADGDEVFAAALRTRAECDLLLATDARTGASVLVDDVPALVTSDRALAIRTLVDRAFARASRPVS